MRELADVYFPDDERSALVLDNLLSRDPAPLDQAFAPTEAKPIRDKLNI